MAANVFDDQILRHILSFVPGSSELAPKYSLQPETGHYLVKAGWPVVLKKMCHWKEADTTICICCIPRSAIRNKLQLIPAWIGMLFGFPGMGN